VSDLYGERGKFAWGGEESDKESRAECNSRSFVGKRELVESSVKKERQKK